ncbi:LAGLIDADG family homing endonuclease [Salinigranum marinum]|uniref:LAGLIDADG family homing endonuclease n=1 Tax=Salinigranum marinum TaxID=1515595 RepID=UPI003CCC9E49
MSNADIGADELVRPIKRTDGETLEERLTANAYNNILPARYLRKDADGNVTESQEELFARVAKNIALAEAVYEADQRGLTVEVGPDQLKPGHPRRDELAAEVFGVGTTADDDVTTTLSAHNVNKFAYDTVVPELPEEIRETVVDYREAFQEQMESLSFMPNSPTLMNAGDELQQLSACFVDSPDDDITDIHQTAKEAAEVFQCLTDTARVAVEGKGVVSIAEVEPGDTIVQRDGGEYRTRNVDEIHAYDDAPTKRVVTEGGISVRGTPNHRLLVNGEWTEIDDIESGDTLSIRLGWLPDNGQAVQLTSTARGGQWAQTRVVSNKAIAELHAENRSDYEIAELLDCSPSTVQRRRANELDLPPNGTGGRKPGVEFDENTFASLHEEGHTDSEIASAVGVHTATIQQYRAAQGLESNGEPVKTVSQPSTLTADLAELVGIWVGDGSVHQDGIRFHINRDDVLNHLDTLSRDLFDTGIDYTWSEGCYEAVIHSHEIKRWWLSNFGDAKPSSAEARVPDPIWRAGHDQIHAFLRGLFSTDGTLTKGRYPRLYSSSERLIDETLQLMLGVGMPVTKWEWENEERDYFTVAPTDAVGLERFADCIGYVDTRAEEMSASIAESPPGPTQCGTVSGDSVWEQQVETVEQCEPETVYDVTVADNHEYVANSVVSHNSGGGMGYAFWRLRPYGDAVGSTGGIASGPITFMRTYDQMCETIAQGGARRGAQMGVMRVSHPDVIQFIHAKNKDVSLAHSLRLNDPDDFTHTSFADALEEARELIDEEGRVPKHLRNAVEGHLSNFNISVGVTDDFMTALENDEEFVFTNPRTEEPHVATPETKELYEMFGLGDHVEVGEVLSIPAADLWEHMVDGAYENGEPGVIYLERVNKQHSFDVEKHPDHRILATNPCVTGDTLVSTQSGLARADELYEQGVARDVVVDGRLSQDLVKEASSVYKTGEKDVYKLTTEEGYELRLTADHQVMTNDGWVEAQDLSAGDTVHIQNRKGAFGRHGSAEEGRVLGWVVGDGHLKHGEERAVLNFYDDDSTLSESFADDVNAVVREPVGNANYDVGVSTIDRGNDYRGSQAVEQRIRSARLYEYADSAGLVKQKHQVPDAVMQGSEEMARGFLRALFSADGSVQGNVEKGVSVRLSSNHTDLLRQVQQLLLNFGIASKLHENRRKAGEKELPDGRGGTRAYETAAQHELIIGKDNLVRFDEEVGFLHERKNAALAERLDAYDRGPYAERFEATVESVEADGHEPVYDLTEPDTHSFVANGLVVHNCGEQPLEEYEACNLGHINLSTVADLDAPDWRVWSDEHADEYDSLDEAVDAFLQEAIDMEEFDTRIDLGTRFLENVVTMSDFPVEKIEKKVREMRKIGLGVMGLAQLYLQLGVRYGSEEGNEVARQLMKHINHESKWASHELAQERGNFADWDDSKYADPLEYREWFEHHTGLSAEEWADGFPVRNHNTTTIAPTGTTSMIGNTSGGCEPIFSVAYFKNVSDDVQGDEMLVEFDDYFLRVLEANDIDVEAVKSEAVEQMQNNEFDGVEGLSAVPKAIGELFVVTADLSGKEHAAVQCACQEGVDSAISKTCNFPNSASREDMDEVYRYIYDNGGKGVTVYRDGTRSKQVLTTRAKNAEFADDEEAAETIVGQIEEVFGGIEGFLDSEEVRAQLEADVEALLGGGQKLGKKRPRPAVLHGVTQRIDTGYGKLYVNINEDAQGNPFELFANIGNSGGFTASFTEALAKTISTALRSGVDPEEIASELQGIRSPKVAWDKGEQINSIPDAIGTAMRRYLDGEIDKQYPQQKNLSELEAEAREREAGAGETDGGAAVAQQSGDAPTLDADEGARADATQDLLDAGESPECPECGNMTLYFSEGCKTCESCGWSEC